MTEETTMNGSVETEQSTQENTIPAAEQSLQENPTTADENTLVNASGNEAEDVTDLKEQMTSLENKMHMQKLNVNEAYADDLLALAKSKVNDTTTMQQVITELVEKYPFFKNPVPTITTSAKTANDNSYTSQDDFSNGFNGVIKKDDFEV